MEKLRNIKHGFDLSESIVGDWFMGCDRCWFKHENNCAVGDQRCPKCRKTLSVFDVTDDDVPPARRAA